MEIFTYVLVLIIASWFVWKGSNLLQSSSKKLSFHYGIPPVIHGTIVLAIGSSFPELSSAVLSILIHQEFELGLSTIIGSAVFNILVIPSVSGIISGKDFLTNKEIIYKEIFFYMISIILLFAAFCCAVIYFPVPGEPMTGLITPGIAWIGIGFYCFYIFIQYQEYLDTREHTIKIRIKIAKQWYLFILSLIIILTAVEALVQCAIYFGDYFNTPPFIWGILVIAGVTSIPDTIVSVKAAKESDSITSIGNVVGSNTFDLLVCIPTGVILAGSATVALHIVTPLMIFLMLASLVLFITLRLKLKLNIFECWVLLLIYVLFILWIILETMGIVDFAQF